MSLLSEKLVCSLKGQSIWVPKVYSCCYTKTRNGSYIASVPTHWTELNLHALFRITTSKEAPYLSGQLCLQFGNFVFALLEPVQEEKALKNVTLDNKELLQLRHHHNLWIWLVEQGKILALHVRHALKTIVLHVRHALKTTVLHVQHLKQSCCTCGTHLKQLCYTCANETTWNCHIYGLDDNLTKKQ